MRDDLAGWYEVGRAHLDLTELRYEPAAIFDDTLVVVFAEHKHGADHGDLGLARVTLELTEIARAP